MAKKKAAAAALLKTINYHSITKMLNYDYFFSSPSITLWRFFPKSG